MNIACPSCSGYGRLPDLKAIEGKTRCPLCSGRGTIQPSLPVPDEVKLVASDLGFTRAKYWRPMQDNGSIHGIPVSGKAIATDGCLIVIEQADGSLFTGHLDNFVKDKITKDKKEKVDVNEGLFD